MLQQAHRPLAAEVLGLVFLSSPQDTAADSLWACHMNSSLSSCCYNLFCRWASIGGAWCLHALSNSECGLELLWFLL